MMYRAIATPLIAGAPFPQFARRRSFDTDKPGEMLTRVALTVNAVMEDLGNYKHDLSHSSILVTFERD